MARWVGCWGLGGGWGDGWVRGLPGDWSGDRADDGDAEGIGVRRRRRGGRGHCAGRGGLL